MKRQAQKAQGFLDLFLDAAPYREHVFQFFELDTKAAFAKAAFDTLQKFICVYGTNPALREGCKNQWFPAIMAKISGFLL